MHNFNFALISLGRTEIFWWTQQVVGLKHVAECLRVILIHFLLKGSSVKLTVLFLSKFLLFTTDALVSCLKKKY